METDSEEEVIIMETDSEEENNYLSDRDLRSIGDSSSQNSDEEDSEPFCFSYSVFKYGNKVSFMTIANHYTYPWLRCSNSADFFHCENQQYDKNTDGNRLKLVLNEISSKKPDLDEILISGSYNADFIDALLFHFVQNSKTFPTISLEFCELSAFFQSSFIVNNGRDLNIVNGKNAVSSDRTIMFKYSYISDNYNNSNRDVVRRSIENCSVFVSWHLFKNEDYTVLTALTRNSYIESLYIDFQYQDYVENVADARINDITKIIIQSKTLSKLGLDFGKKFLFFTEWDDFTEALINSKTIYDLTFYNFKNLEIVSFQKFCSVLEQKTNIRRLRLDSSLICFTNEEFTSDSERYQFKEPIFINILQNLNSNQLHELDIKFPPMLEEWSQEILMFFKLLKDSCIERFIVKHENIDQGTEYQYMNLFVDTIPFMKGLRYFEVHYDIDALSTNLIKSFSEAVRTCNSSLLEVYSFQKYRVPKRKRPIGVKKILRRNRQLIDFIQIKTTLPKITVPKVASVAKHTGPDAIFHILCHLGLSIGPNEYILILPEVASNTKTATINNEQRKRKGP